MNVSYLSEKLILLLSGAVLVKRKCMLTNVEIRKFKLCQEGPHLSQG